MAVKRPSPRPLWIAQGRLLVDRQGQPTHLLEDIQTVWAKSWERCPMSSRTRIRQRARPMPASDAEHDGGVRSTRPARSGLWPSWRHRHVPQRTDHQRKTSEEVRYFIGTSVPSQVLWPGLAQSLGIETAYMAHGLTFARTPVGFKTVAGRRTSGCCGGFPELAGAASDKSSIACKRLSAALNTAFLEEIRSGCEIRHL